MVNRFPPPSSLRPRSAAVVLLLFLGGLTVRADGIDQTLLTGKDLDPAALAEWIGGHERPLTLKDGQKPPIWTRNGRIEWSGHNVRRILRTRRAPPPDRIHRARQRSAPCSSVAADV
jgi:hypothetical protein